MNLAGFKNLKYMSTIRIIEYDYLKSTLVDMISPCHAADPGLIPQQGILNNLRIFLKFPKFYQILACPPGFQARIGNMKLFPVKLDSTMQPYKLSKPPQYAAVSIKIAFESCDFTKSNWVHCKSLHWKKDIQTSFLALYVI